MTMFKFYLRDSLFFFNTLNRNLDFIIFYFIWDYNYIHFPPGQFTFPLIFKNQKICLITKINSVREGISWT